MRMKLTDDLIDKLERELMNTLAEFENMRNKVQQLSDENEALKADIMDFKSKEERTTNKVEDLISLLNTVNVYDHGHAAQNVQQIKPVLVQEG